MAWVVSCKSWCLRFVVVADFCAQCFRARARQVRVNENTAKHRRHCVVARLWRILVEVSRCSDVLAMQNRSASPIGNSRQFSILASHPE
jgi:hypothetical protein